MEFRALVEHRVSVRQFKPDPVPAADIREMVRIAGLAPSPNNSQPWRFVAISNADLLKRMAAAVQAKVQSLIPEIPQDPNRHTRQRVEWFSTFFAEAPLVLAAIALPYESAISSALGDGPVTAAQVNAMRGQPDIQSVGAAVEHLLLAASDMGYGGCWLSGPLVAREGLETLLGISSPERLATMVAIGRPAAVHPASHDRKAVDDILSFMA